MSTVSSSLLPPSSTVLVTGGASGIGLGLVKQLVSRGHKVIIVGRRQSKLDEAKAVIPELHSFQGDVGSEVERTKLFETAVSLYPDINVLINNAGVYLNHGDDITDKSNWEIFKQHNTINSEGTIHLSYLFADYFKKNSNKKTLIAINTSIVAFIPLKSNLSYSISKAVLHHFSVGFRLQLKDTNVSVVEFYPGPVKTDMLPAGLDAIAANVDDYAADVINQIELGHTEFGLTGSPFENLSRANYETIQ
eukprot:CAMPEP_0196765728 /NCGR_PEP_ID=MMETSP1095-20130614/11253_1 /TAXON_ID=96789 ORGANISM="Chromulina nebulosa, Strain UTEXLB2642" /NCGR_SAMPLE_ID=MMETSP1095 /ASSEMBLY_ACC=CAM_ASM_000446 /LENGTH=248 /DNA_ID=CAMNT_0042124283 /DNA_START=34 /DNA_END=777 /DNA_ORIENTATION=+